ncbi:MAG: DNA repair protein RadC [Bdellovibrionota bacterium]
MAHIDVHERPHERLTSEGAQPLSDLELMTILLGGGTRTRTLPTLAEDTLRLLDQHGTALSVTALTAIGGISAAKAALVVAALELARRRIQPAGVRIKSAADVLPLIRHYANRKQEYFLAVTLNGAHEVIATRVITLGLLNRAPVHPREVYADAITDRAAAVIVAHNHPSGDLSPSAEDLEVTKQLNAAANILGLNLLDHVIFTLEGFYSLAEHGLL